MTRILNDTSIYDIKLWGCSPLKTSCGTIIIIDMNQTHIGIYKEIDLESECVFQLLYQAWYTV